MNKILVVGIEITETVLKITDTIVNVMAEKDLEMIETVEKVIYQVRGTNLPT